MKRSFLIRYESSALISADRANMTAYDSGVHVGAVRRQAESWLPYKRRPRECIA